jgi:membrane-associated phospholipid phosphatase
MESLSTATLVLVVAFSRIVLGAHFLTDVLAAIFFGIIWLMLYTVLGSPFNGGPSLQRFPLVIARI